MKVASKPFGLKQKINSWGICNMEEKLEKVTVSEEYAWSWLCPNCGEYNITAKNTIVECPACKKSYLARSSYYYDT